MNIDFKAINQSTDCRQLMAKYRPLVRQGAVLFTQCLWHDDTKPSLRVNEHFVFCYSCGHNEAPVGLYARLTGLSLPDAARELAGLSLAPLPPIPVVSSTKRAPVPPPTATAELTLARFIERRKLNPSVLADFGVRQVRWGGRPAIQYPTPMGIDRIKFLDGNGPKNVWAAKGGKPCWYGLDRIGAAIPENSSAWPRIYVVNGEPSVWAGATHGIPAVCTLAGEGSVPAALVLDMHARGVDSVRVVYDLDDTGQAGADLMVKAFRLAGIRDAAALTLPASLGPRGDFDDLCRRYGPDARTVLESGEFYAYRPTMNAIYVDNRLRGMLQSLDGLMRRAMSSSHHPHVWEHIADRQAAIREVKGRMNERQRD